MLELGKVIWVINFLGDLGDFYLLKIKKKRRQNKKR